MSYDNVNKYVKCIKVFVFNSIQQYSPIMTKTKYVFDWNSYIY